MSAIQLTFIVLTFTLPPALAWACRGAGRPALDRKISLALAVILLLLEGIELACKVHDGNFTAQNGLPLQLCDWALFAAASALLFRWQTAFDLAYFWGLAGTVQALFTPAVGADLSRWRVAGFFASHSAIVVSVLFMVLARHFRPWPKSLPRVLIWSEVYLVTALLVDAWTGANYGFLSHKPVTRSMLDWLSDEHWRCVLEINGLAILFFAFLYAPWWLADRLGGRREPSSR